MYSITNLAVNDFIEKLAAPTFPNPAVGSAAAIAGAMAAALVEMSYEITIKKAEEQQEGLIKYIKELREIRQHCLLLATEDMKAYDEVVNATRLKEKYPNEYETAMKNATDTLVRVVKNCELILAHVQQVIETCYVKVLGDLAGSAYLAEAAAAAAKTGVEVNLKLITDKDYKKEVSILVQSSYKKSSETKDKIIAAMQNSKGKTGNG